MKKLYFVIGPESSGTRLTTRILCESGCFGDFEHYQRLDEFVNLNRSLDSIVGDSKLIVFRRSVPHGGEFPFVPDIELMFSTYGFDPYILIPIRNLFELCKSKMKNQGIESMEGAYYAFQHEINFIINTIKEYNKILFYDTSFLFKFPDLSLKSLGLWTGLDIPIEKVKEFLYDADKNYVEE